MSIKNKWKRNIIFTIAIISIVMSMLNPALTTFADLESSEKDFNKKSGEFLKDAEDAKDIVKILNKDAEINPNPKRNTINYVMRRLFYPGIYVNDVRDGVLSSDVAGKKEDFVYDGVHSCNPNSPNNLINHNCNIPNFTTGLIQNIAEPFIQPFSNAEKTSSYAVFGLGVPNNIPGGKIPINPSARKHTYTALELYGYNLQLTSYNGEWDQVVASHPARMLSNFGVIDKITLAGTSLWNGLRDGTSEFIENFSFNPVRWFSSIGKAFETGASSGINTIVDTSELNVIATHGWTRPNLDKTLYNVYVMSDNEVIQETALSYFTIFTKELDKKANESDELSAVIGMNPNNALSGNIAFKYNPKMETEESIKKREKAEKTRQNEINTNKNEKLIEDFFKKNPELGEYKAKIISPLTKIPKPVYYTESEQLGFWEEKPEVESLLSKARKNGLLSKSNASKYKNYNELKSEWEEEYTPYFQREFDALGATVTEILEKNDSDIFQKYPYLDPKQGLSRYACAKSDGTVMRNKNGTVEYLYKDNNKGEKESLNPLCKSPRSPIGGGLFGTGWENNNINDTRHISNISDDVFFGNKVSSVSMSAVRSLNSFTAKVTNVILGLSFSPVLEKLGINTIIASLVDSFRDTVFFPLVGLTAAIGAVLLFLQLLRNGSAWQLLTSILFTFLIFIVGAAFLLHPGSTLKVIDEIPSKVDNVIADAVLGGSDSSYCSTGKDKSGVRSAQCSVWGAMVFEPWVHLQFGTGYDNLYAKGFAPSGSGAMKNNNAELVGNAEVNMGNGKKINNWAMYQLSKTKSGTINNHDNRDKLGNVDPNMYRLVDLQAGPKGEKYDNRFFDNWNGKERSGGMIALTFVQAVLMAFAIAGLGFAKIEVSFMFSLSILFLPFMLLYAMLPKGKIKFKSYLTNLGTLLIKRIIIVVMISVLLRIIIEAYSKAESLQIGAISSIFISIAFLLYKNEILSMITSSEGGQGLLGGQPGQIKEALGEIVPKGVKQKYSTMKAGAKGAVAGATGGLLGAAQHRAQLQARKTGILVAMMANMGTRDEDEKQMKSEILTDKLNNVNDSIMGMKNLSSSHADFLRDEQLRKMEKVNKNKEAINNLEQYDKESGTKNNVNIINDLEKENLRLENEISSIEKRLEAGVRDNALTGSVKRGLQQSSEIIGRMSERRIRSEGYAPLTAFNDVKEAVYSEGAKKITELDDTIAHDVYREILSHTESSPSKSTDRSLEQQESGQLINNPEIQKKVRQIAEKRRKMANEENYSAFDSNHFDVEKVAEYIDNKREKQTMKKVLTNPIKGLKEIDELERKKRQQKEMSSNVEDVREVFDRKAEDPDKQDLKSKQVDLLKERYDKIIKDKKEIEEKRKAIEDMENNHIEGDD